MSLPRFALRRPVSIGTLAAGVFFLSILVLPRLGVEFLPSMEIPTLAVVTPYPGASPESVELDVTAPLEKLLASLPGLATLDSYSMPSLSVINVFFHWGVDTGQALQEVRAALEQADRVLPAQAGTPGVLRADPSQLPVLVVGVSGPGGREGVGRLVTETLRPALESLPGVASVSVDGVSEPFVGVYYRPDALVDAGLDPAKLGAILQYQNVSVPGGVVEEKGRHLSTRVGYRFEQLEDLENLVLLPRPNPSEQPFLGLGVILPNFLRLGDVADVRLEPGEPRSRVRVDGQEGVLVSVRQTPGANTVAVSSRVREALEELAGAHPGLHVSWVLDAGAIIASSLRSMALLGGVGALLSVAGLWFFFCRLQVVLIIGVAVPLSLAVALLLMGATGLSLNLMTLGGLSLGSGMLVDAGVVVAGAVLLHREPGSRRRPDEVAAATARVTEAITPALLTSTATTVCVFLPILASRGLVRAFFGQLALAVVFSVLASLAVALVVIPLGLARALSKAPVSAPEQAGEGAPPAASRLAVALETGYERLLYRLCRRPVTPVLICLLLVGTVPLVWRLLPVKILTPIDEGVLSIELRLPPGTPLDTTEAAMKRVEAVLADTPEVTGYVAVAGSQGLGDLTSATLNEGEHYARFTVRLHPASARAQSVDEVAAALARRLGAAGPLADKPVDLQVYRSSALAASARLLAPTLSLVVHGPDTPRERVAREVARQLRAVPGVADVSTSLEQTRPELFLTVDPARAAQAGVPAAQVGLAVRDALLGAEVTRVTLGGRSFPVRLHPSATGATTLETLLELPVVSPLPGPGGEVARTRLGKIVQVAEHPVPTVVRRIGGERVTQVTARLTDPDTGGTLDRVQQLLAGLSLPPGVRISVGGAQEVLHESFQDLYTVLALAVLLVFFALVLHFDALGRSLLVFLAVPLGGVGAVHLLWLVGEPLTLTALMGFTVLAGTGVKDAILLVDYMSRSLDERGSPLEAAVVGASRRLVPVLLTSFTTVVALLPILLVPLPGADIHRPLAATVVGGITSSTLLSLLLIPPLFARLVRPHRLSRAGVPSGQAAPRTPPSPALHPRRHAEPPHGG